MLVARAAVSRRLFLQAGKWQASPRALGRLLNLQTRPAWEPNIKYLDNTGFSRRVDGRLTRVAAQMTTRQRALDGQQEPPTMPTEPQTALSKRERDQTPDAQDSWADAVAAKRQASEAETQPTQPPDEARAPASPPDPKTA